VVERGHRELDAGEVDSRGHDHHHGRSFRLASRRIIVQTG
jgi:hypothetical protein